MIQAFHVYKQYDRESMALSDITLHVAKGDFCFLTLKALTPRKNRFA